MNITIREAGAADALLVANLSRQTFFDAFAADNTEADMQLFLDEQFAVDSLVKEVGAPGNTFLLAYAGNEVAGYVRLREGTPPEGVQAHKALEIARLYAVTAFIGKGVGKALMQASIDNARQQGAAAVWLGVWEKNDRAIAFYKAWGFEKVGEQPFVLGRDLQRDWLMAKYL